LPGFGWSYRVLARVGRLGCQWPWSGDRDSLVQDTDEGVKRRDGEGERAVGVSRRDVGVDEDVTF
jgi:hypothetical protein